MAGCPDQPSQNAPIPPRAATHLRQAGDRPLDTPESGEAQFQPNALRLAGWVVCLCAIACVILGARVGAAGNPPYQTSSKRGTITGRVTDDTGKPVSGAEVYIWPIGSGIGRRSATTDDDGKFSVSDLGPTVYRVIAYAPSFVNGSDDDLDPVYRPGDSADIKMVRGGVITGTVTSSDGNPVIAIEVQAMRVKDATGRRISQSESDSNRRTDDRGTYRIYGLPAGSYQVFVGGPGNFNQGIAYIGDSPTYYPSATIDTAQEVGVGTGQEISGIDINYRGDRGHTISGSVADNLSTTPSSNSSDRVVLRQGASIVARSFIFSRNSRDKTFSITGIPDGQYEILAEAFTDGDIAGASPANRITIKGGDVTGLNLVVSALGTISGAVVLDPLAENLRAGCKTKPISDLLGQTAIAAVPDKSEGTLLFPEQGSAIWGAIDDKAHFSLSGFPAGTHHLEPSLPGESWYVSSIERQDAGGAQTGAGGRSAKGQGPARAESPETRAAVRDNGPSAKGDAIELKSGEKVENVTITLSEGAALLRGRVVMPSSTGPASPSSPVRVYLVPTEQERLKNPLYFVESAVSRDGTFEIHRIPPGKYRAVVQPEPLDKDKPGPVRKAMWDAALRKKLTQSARAVTDVIEFKPCGQETDYSVRYGAAENPASTPPVAPHPPGR
jgi:hypothetical protein